MPYNDPARQREYQRRWRAQRRADWFEGKSCTQCGLTEHLELDHIDPNLKVDHKIWSWSADRREAEIAKCQVLCFTCHKAKSDQAMRKEVHGIPSMYARGCRCRECKNMNAARGRAFRARKREEKIRCAQGTSLVGLSPPT